MPPKVEQFKEMARQARKDLFDQAHPVGRLSLVQSAMLGGDTLVTISLAGSLFFSISPDAADHKVLLYLLFTLAPFAIVSPILGPLIDRGRGCPAAHGRGVGGRAGRAVPADGAAHPQPPALPPGLPRPRVLEALPRHQGRPGARDGRAPGPLARRGRAEEQAGYATLNARLTLLGTVSGFVVSVPAVILYKLGSSQAVLFFAMLVFAAAAVAGARLPVISGRDAARRGPTSPQGPGSTGRRGTHSSVSAT